MTISWRRNKAFKNKGTEIGIFGHSVISWKRGSQNGQERRYTKKVSFSIIRPNMEIIGPSPPKYQFILQKCLFYQKRLANAVPMRGQPPVHFKL